MLKNYIVIFAVAAGTYLTRYLPIHYRERFETTGRLDEFFTYSSTALISALFITAFVSIPVDPEALLRGAVTLFFVALIYKKWRNLGLSVILGVGIHLLNGYVFDWFKNIL